MENVKIFFDAMHNRLDDPASDISYIKEMEKTSNLCRYMDLPELICLIQEGVLEFKQLALFDDPNENRIFLSDEVAEDYYAENEEEIDISYEVFLENLKRILIIDCLQIYALCFTLNCDDQYMWDHHTGKHIMVKVENIRSLAESFKVENKPNPKILIEKIRYIDSKDPEKAKAELGEYARDPYSASFIKDQAYEKENEIRAMCQVDTIFEGAKNLSAVIATHLPPVLKISANPDIFIKEIVLSPYLPESKQEAIKSVIQSLSPHLKVSQSRIEPPPNLYKKLLREIDFSHDMLSNSVGRKRLGLYKQIIINDDGTYEIELTRDDIPLS